MASAKTKAEVHYKLWGMEAWFANSPLYCGKILFVKQGWRCSIHHHRIKHETFFVSKGEVYMEVDNEAFYMSEGDSVALPPNTKHRFTGIAPGFSQIVECSTQHFEDDSYRDVESGVVPNDEWNELKSLRNK